jgi:hypothetical protein
MAWIVETIIGEIHASYVALPGGRTPLSVDDNNKPEIGNIHKARNADTGRTIWVMQTGNFGSPTLATSAAPADPNAPPEQPAPHWQALTRFWVWIWQDTQELAWNVMVDLLAAMRATVYGPNLGPQNFTFPTEIEGRDMEKGSLCVLDVTISIPMPIVGTVPVEEVAIESFIGNVRTRGDLNALEPGPPAPAPDFDLVIVTNDDPTDD